MDKSKQTGKLGEQLAQDYLTAQGYAILESNWRSGHLEADIIAYKEGLIVLVEVKTRSSQSHGEPEDFVTPGKQQAYIKLANAYVQTHWRDEEVRFDIISVTFNGDSYSLKHLENAFTAAGIYR